MHLHGTETARIPELVFSLKHNLHDVIELLKINVLSTAVLSANTIPPTIAHFLVKKNHLSIVNQLSSKHTLRSGSQNHTHLLFTSIQVLGKVTAQNVIAQMQRWTSLGSHSRNLLHLSRFWLTICWSSSWRRFVWPFKISRCGLWNYKTDGRLLKSRCKVDGEEEDVTLTLRVVWET